MGIAIASERTMRTLDPEMLLRKAAANAVSQSKSETAGAVMPLQAFEQLKDALSGLKRGLPSPDVYATAIRRYFSARGVPANDVDDMTQDVYEFALSRWYLFVPSRQSYPDWLRGVCRTVWKRWTKERPVEHREDDRPKREGIGVVETAVFPHEPAETLLEHLTPSLRIAFQAYLRGFRSNDAYRMGLKPSTFRQRVCRARAQLRHLAEDE